MPFKSALENLTFLALPALVYALVVRWRAGLSGAELAARLGLKVGKAGPYAIALFAAIPMVALNLRFSATLGRFPGSMIAPLWDARPTPGVVAQVFAYGVIATGFPEELLFRGLIGGALFRRLPFRAANSLQALIFLLPHLAILRVAPNIWFLVVFGVSGYGLLLGWLRHISGSIGPSTVMHSIGNMGAALAVLNWAG